jgi:hydroxyacylglutathione hydrolase
MSFETHLHADFVSGHRELARRTGAQIYLGAGSGATSIGDVGRPDLSDTYTPQELADLLYDSLRHKLLPLPDETLVYPAHGAGSMCGRNIGADRNSTMGRERQSNYALKPMSRDGFIGLLTADLPARPEYFQRDVDLNRCGAAALTDLPPLLPLPAREAARLQQAGAILGLDRDLILLAKDRKQAEESRQRLARVGIERVVGFIDGGFASWVEAGLPLAQTAQISADEVAHDPTLSIVDVRTPPEWSAGHAAGAISAPLVQLRETLPNSIPNELSPCIAKAATAASSPAACSKLLASNAC